MNNFSSRRLRLWECAMLFAFSLTLVTGVWAAGSQSALADKVVRLHVIANSDSDADQALKLRVRDAVLAAAGDCLDGVTDRWTSIPKCWSIRPVDLPRAVLKRTPDSPDAS